MSNPDITLGSAILRAVLGDSFALCTQRIWGFSGCMRSPGFTPRNSWYERCFISIIQRVLIFNICLLFLTISILINKSSQIRKKIQNKY